MSCLSQTSKKRRIREELKELKNQDQFIFNNQLDFEEHDDEAVGLEYKNNAGWYIYNIINIVINNCIVIVYTN